MVISRARQQQQREKQHNNLNPFESMHINLKRSKVPLVLVGPALLRAFKKDDEVEVILDWDKSLDEFIKAGPKEEYLVKNATYGPAYVYKRQLCNYRIVI